MLTSHAHRHSVDRMLGWLLYDQASVQYRQRIRGSVTLSSPLSVSDKIPPFSKHTSNANTTTNNHHACKYLALT